MNKTTIEWTRGDDGSPGYTWNTTTGCTHVSDGCKYCYAEALSLRFGRSKHPWIKPFEAENVKVHPERLRQPFSLKGNPRVFVDSMSDLFHGLVPAEHVAKVFAVMAATPRVTYQILTKRPERMAQLLADPTVEQAVGEAADNLAGEWGWCHIWGNHDDDFPWPLPNVWLGTSIEDNRVVGRADWLRATPAAVRFLSCEPLIGPLDRLDLTGIDWVITGGESGVHHRPFDPDWARDVRDRCLTQGIAYFHKQNGGRTPKAGGRLLDGREWNQFPAFGTAAAP